MIISDRTKDDYLALAGSLRRRFTRETWQEPETDWERFTEWLDDLYATLAPASRRYYHAALVYYQGVHHPDYPVNPIPRGLVNRKAIREAFGLRGPAQKSKAFPAHVESAIIDTLMNICQRPKASIYTTWALAFLQAGVAFGLRPSEWLRVRFMSLEDASMVLHVVNAKQSEERAFGPTRTLLINEEIVGTQPYNAAKWLIRNSLTMTLEQFDKVLKRSAQQLRRVIKSCGAPCRPRSGNSITLYTARHQFAANAKRAGMTLVEIAALMGHASTDTAAEHYGRRRYGRSGNCMAVTPHPDNVQTVQKIANRKALQKTTRQTKSKSFGPR